MTLATPNVIHLIGNEVPASFWEQTMTIMEDAERVTDGDIVQVAAGTLGGEWLRRYWLAVGLAAELRDIPQAVPVLGEDLVLFRDGEGRPGLVGLHCPHRGTSLE